jgi:hypothetical protein
MPPDGCRNAVVLRDRLRKKGYREITVDNIKKALARIPEGDQELAA